MSSPDQPNRLRFSIDIKSIKDHDFLGQVFAKFSPVPELGITKQFRTNPVLQLSTPKVEEIFLNGFSSYYFNATGSTLDDLLQRVVEVELWHSDRMKKDILIGVVKVDVKGIAECPVRKASNGYARVFDAYLPVDEVNEGGEIVKKVATMRVLMYLEDLGPVSSLREREQELGLKEQLVYDRDMPPPMLPSQHQQPSTLDRIRQIQLNQLQYKVVWELQVWKKAQEAKTKIHFKQKEVQFLAELAAQQQKLNLEKQKEFRKIQGNMVLQQKKLDGIMADLKKREQKLVLLEQETQNKITEMSRYCLGKDEAVAKAELKLKEEKTGWARERAGLEAQITSLKGQNTRLRIEVQEANKEDQRSPINIIRNQLNNRINQNNSLLKSLDDAIKVNELYKESYQKLKTDFQKLRNEGETKKSKMDTLFTENEVLKQKEKFLQEQLSQMNQNLKGYAQNSHLQYNNPPQGYNQNQNYNHNHHNGYNYDQNPQPQPTFSNKIERLKYERQQYLNSGVYTVNDPFILEYDKLIAEGY